MFTRRCLFLQSTERLKPLDLRDQGSNPSLRGIVVVSLHKGVVTSEMQTLTEYLLILKCLTEWPSPHFCSCFNFSQNIHSQTKSATISGCENKRVRKCLFGCLSQFSLISASAHLKIDPLRTSCVAKPSYPGSPPYECKKMSPIKVLTATTKR